VSNRHLWRWTIYTSLFPDIVSGHFTRERKWRELTLYSPSKEVGSSSLLVPLGGENALEGQTLCTEKAEGS
jgi:hypothetical protein